MISNIITNFYIIDAFVYIFPLKKNLVKSSFTSSIGCALKHNLEHRLSNFLNIEYMNDFIWGLPEGYRLPSYLIFIYPSMDFNNVVTALKMFHEWSYISGAVHGIALRIKSRIAINEVEMDVHCSEFWNNLKGNQPMKIDVDSFWSWTRSCAVYSDFCSLKSNGFKTMAFTGYTFDYHSKDTCIDKKVSLR